MNERELAGEDRRAADDDEKRNENLVRLIMPSFFVFICSCN